ncbi:MAG: hypothetical protein R3C49_09165 [Planctomycetaceae bacterium]
MKCKHCRTKKYLRLSQSRDHWLLRLVLLKFLRCRHCGHGFLAAIWHKTPQPARKSQAAPQPEWSEHAPAA